MNHLLGALRAFLVFTVITGCLYPVAVTSAGRVFFPRQAKGSLVLNGGNVIGSELIAQKFEQPKYFWPRPSAIDYSAQPSGGSNLGPTAKALQEAMQQRKAKGSEGELLTASASGLDPHISPEAARSQVPRVALARKLDADMQRKLLETIEKLAQDRDFGLLGERRVNVLMLNLALDKGI